MFSVLFHKLFDVTQDAYTWQYSVPIRHSHYGVSFLLT